MSLDEAQADDDVRTINGIQVGIEGQIVDHVANVTLDVDEDEDGEQGLVMAGAGDDCC
ncbi:hypothetical protein B0H94_101257 [Salsuginibacillus halophilus]|uniref:Uncharacterized protein n=1 Tax=Salsuginibacillus halophilus TaxID=517424 RepID=A0A2P8HYR8_9BACI|nr:hypothetical protein [Salsuginibacillus halophilus]PSL51343.1 hypothetical protein B0H94_101257 [Salsuginibacillus halophilus]